MRSPFDKAGSRVMPSLPRADKVGISLFVCLSRENVDMRLMRARREIDQGSQNGSLAAFHNSWT